MSEENKETRVKKRKFLIPLAIIAIIAVCACVIYNSQFETTDDAYIEADLIQVTPKVAGHIVESYLVDNREVKKGEVVAKIDDAVYREKYIQAKANYQRALSNQKNARAILKSADSDITLAKIDLERYQKLYQEGSVSKQTLDNAKVRYDGALARQTQAKENVIGDGRNVADADIKALEALMNQARLNLEYTNVKSPNTGKVTNRRIEVGSYVAPGAPLFAVVPDKIWVVANFKENQIGNMHPGQEVEIKVDAYKNKTFKGKIDSIQSASGAKSSLFPPENAVGSFVKIVQRIPVKIVFDEAIDKEQYNIVSGMSVVPKVRIK